MEREFLNIKERFRQLDDAIELCIKNDLTIPYLLLIYPAIDIAGWLNSEDPKEGVRVRFTNWVDQYILPTGLLECTSMELYGGRCGILHCLSADSDLSEKGKVRTVFYASNDKEKNKLQELLSLHKIPNYILIGLGELLKAYRLGIDKFMKELLDNPTRATKVYKKAEIMLDLLPDEVMNDLFLRDKGNV